MALYNLTTIQNASTIGGLVTAANAATSGILFGVTVISVFIIFTILFSREYPFIDVIMANSFIMFILTAFLAYANYLSIMFPLGFLSALAITTFLSWMMRST